MTMPPPTGLRIGVLTEPPVEGLTVDPACAAAVGTTLGALESAGHHVVDAPLPLPPADELIAALLTIWNVGGAGVELADPSRVEPRNLALREAARATDSWTYAQGVRKTQHLSRRIVEGFCAGYDLLVTPTMACLPPPVGAWRPGTDDDPLMAILNSYPMAIFTSLFNVTGQPAISVPIHHDDATGLPVGVQIVAAPWREDLLLQVTRGLELAHPWTGRRPPVS
jgi:amidase